MHVRGGVLERGARETARRAREGAQLPVLAIRVLQHGGATLTHLRVGHRVLRQAEVLVHAEGDGAVRRAVRDGGAQRVVGVVHEHGVRRLLKRAHDAVLDAVDFAHAVKLIAKQVEQHHVGGLQLRQNLRQPQLVALEHAPVGWARVQQRGCHARVEVRAGAVAHHAVPGQLEGVGQQIRHRGFAVCAHDAYRALFQLRRQVRYEVGVHVQRDFAGEVRGGTVEHVLEPPR